MKATALDRELWNSLDSLMVDLHEESDRGCVLTAHIYLDGKLKDILRSHLMRISGRKKLIESLTDDGPSAALGYLSSRALAAVSMGLIDEGTYRALVRLNKIRNDFGHTPQRKLLREHVESLVATLPADAKRTAREAISQLESKNFREQFTAVASVIVWAVLGFVKSETTRT